jgi:hypothetical protein
MPQYYLTVPTSISLPANGSKVDLSTSAEIHRDDGAVPNALTVTNGAYNVFLLSDPTTETAAVAATATATWIGRSSAVAPLRDSVATVDLSSVSTGDILRIGVAVTLGGTGINRVTGLQLEGSSATLVVTSEGSESWNGDALIFEIVCPAAAAGNASADITVSSDPSANISWVPGVWKINDESTGTFDTAAAGTVGSSVSLNVDTGAGCVVAVVVSYDENRTVTWTGVTRDGTDLTSGTKTVSWASAAVTAATPRTVTATFNASQEFAGVAEAIV